MSMLGFENFCIFGLPGDNEIYNLSSTTQADLCSFSNHFF